MDRYIINGKPFSFEEIKKNFGELEEFYERYFVFTGTNDSEKKSIIGIIGLIDNSIIEDFYQVNRTMMNILINNINDFDNFKCLYQRENTFYNDIQMIELIDLKPNIINLGKYTYLEDNFKDLKKHLKADAEYKYFQILKKAILK